MSLSQFGLYLSMGSLFGYFRTVNLLDLPIQQNNRGKISDFVAVSQCCPTGTDRL